MGGTLMIERREKSMLAIIMIMIKIKILIMIMKILTLIIDRREKSMLAMGREGRQATRPNESSTQLKTTKG